MRDRQLVVDAETLDLLLSYVIDSYEKLEIVMCLHHATGAAPLTVEALAARTCLPWGVVAEEISELHRAGLVATVHDDGAGWWLDEHPGWAEMIEVVVRIYERDRSILLRRMARLALHRLRAGERGTAHMVRMRFKQEP